MSKEDRTERMKDRFSSQPADTGTDTDTTVSTGDGDGDDEQGADNEMAGGSDEGSDSTTGSSGESEYVCQVCGDGFDSYRGVRSHEGQVHDYEREDVGDRPDGVRVQFRVPDKGFRTRFNRIAYGKLLMELDDRGRSDLADQLSQPDMQHAALQALLDNPGVWADALEDLHG